MTPRINIEEDIQRAEVGEQSESRIQLEMERIWRIARDDEGHHTPEIPTDDLLTTLEEIDHDSPIIDALHGLVRWEREEDYHDGAVHAWNAFEDVVDQADENDWYNVGQYATIQAASIASATNDEEQTHNWLEKCNDLFRANWRELTPNTRGNTLDSLPELLHNAETDLEDRIIDTLRTIASEAAEDDDFELQRRVLRSVRQILHERGDDTSTVERGIVESYNEEAELKSDFPHQKAFLLQEALDTCADYVEQDQLLEWKREMREANRRAIDEMPVRTQELEEDEVDELERAIEDTVENLRELSDSSSPAAALLTLLADRNFVPQLDALESGAEAAPLLELVSTRNLSSEGDAIPDPEDQSRPSVYSFGVQHRDNILCALLHRVFSQRVVTEGDLYLYLEATDGLTVHDRAYLTDFVIAFFDRRYSDALHLGVPRLEGLIASELKAKGYETASLQEGYTTPTPLPGLLNMLDGEVDGDLVEYLRYRYADISGEGLRNKVAHGRSSYHHANHRVCLILLYDIFRTIAWLEDELSEFEEGGS